ncbi:MAG: GrpB family protein [Anaerolineae bacterium]|nr:GrpB family protein [Anaerolineae bacterium]
MELIGLEKGVVRLVPYNDEWKRFFEEEKAHLQAVVGNYVLDIQHVGSTSIPGGMAKPIIDIAIAVASFEEAFVCVEPLEQIEYEYMGEHGIARRHYFVKRNPHTTHHVHINELDSRSWKDHILFRDYLLEHPKTVDEYTAVKLKLAEQFPFDREAYTNRKGSFIEHTLQMARSE